MSRRVPASAGATLHASALHTSGQTWLCPVGAGQTHMHRGSD